MKLLDLYCGVGGCSVGYARAGFEVVGVDIATQPDYPFEFHQGDAVEFLKAHGHEFDAIHASPPCQFYSGLTQGTNQNTRLHRHRRSIGPVREVLLTFDAPIVIENVNNAPLRKDLTLCGEMFGLRVIRHRNFELHGFRPKRPFHPRHRGLVQGWDHGTYREGYYFAVYGDGGGKGSVADWRAAMGIDWTVNKRSLAEAIPPAYTEWIGNALMRHLGATAPAG